MKEIEIILTPCICLKDCFLDGLKFINTRQYGYSHYKDYTFIYDETPDELAQIKKEQFDEYFMDLAIYRNEQIMDILK